MMINQITFIIVLLQALKIIVIIVQEVWKVIIQPIAERRQINSLDNNLPSRPWSVKNELLSSRIYTKVGSSFDR